MPGISEQLLQAMEIIANNSVKSLNFDQTKTYTIQENLGDGSYIVTDGSVTFTAYSSASYKVGETVYVQIPQGDFGNQKNIIGKKVTTSREPYNYIRPLDQMLVQVNFNGGDQTWGLIANKDSKNPDKKIIYTWEYNENQPQISGYDKLVISADINTLFHANEGTYGIKIHMWDDSNNYYLKIFSSNEMFGNLYPTGGFFQQEHLFDISEIPKIQKFQIEFYEDSNFKPNTYIKNIENIFLKNLKIYFGIGNDKKTFNIICDDGTNGIYHMYDEDGKILDINSSQIKRSLSIDLSKDLQNSKEFELAWIFPKAAESMIKKFNTDPTDSNYYINEKYYNKYNNNVVKAVIRIGNNFFAAEKEFTFGPQGTNIDDKTLSFQYYNNYALCIDNSDSLQDLQIKFSLLDSKREEIQNVDYSTFKSDNRILFPEIDDLFKINENNILEILDDQIIKVNNDGIGISNNGMLFYNEQDNNVIINSVEIDKTGIIRIRNKDMSFEDYPYLYIDVNAKTEDNSNLDIRIPLSISADREKYSYITGPLEVNYTSNGKASYLKEPYKLYTNTGIERPENIAWEVYNVTHYQPNTYYIKDQEGNFVLDTRENFDKEEIYYTEYNKRLGVNFFKNNYFYSLTKNITGDGYEYKLIPDEKTFISSTAPYYTLEVRTLWIDTLTQKDYESNNGLQYYYYGEEKGQKPLSELFQVTEDNVLVVDKTSNLMEVTNNNIVLVQDTGMFSVNDQNNFVITNNKFIKINREFIEDSESGVKKVSPSWEEFLEWLGVDDVEKLKDFSFSLGQENYYKAVNNLTLFKNNYYYADEDSKIKISLKVDENNNIIEEIPQVGYEAIYSVIKIQEKPTLSSDFKIENNQLVPLNTYFTNLEKSKLLLVGKIKENNEDNETIVWISPLRIYREYLNNTYYNESTGIDATIEQLGIQTADLTLGSNRENGFTGVSVGKYIDSIGTTKEEHSGIYGFYEGSSVFGLRDDGVAYFGKDGGGRILIDGTKSTIESQQYLETEQKEGLIIDFDDGFLRASREDTVETSEDETSLSTLIKSIKIDSTNPIYPLMIGYGTSTESPKFKVDWNGVVHAADIVIEKIRTETGDSADLATVAYVDGVVNALKENINANNNIVNKKLNDLETGVNNINTTLQNINITLQNIDTKISDLEERITKLEENNS